MARDDEFRKVAEDIGALARSLGRDFREAVDQAIRGGYPPGRAVKHGLRGLGHEARRGMRSTWTSPYGRRPGRPWTPWGWGCGPGSDPRFGHWGRNAWAPPPPPPGAPPAGGPGSAVPPGGPAGPAWTQSQPSAPPWNGPRRKRDPLPPIRHRWDATTVLGLLAVLFGVAWLIGATGALHVSIEGVVAVGLMLLGASLVVTGRTDWSLSRRSWPVWLGAALIVVLVATSTTFGFGGGLSSVSFGNKSVVAAPNSTVHGGFGDLTVSLPASVPKDSTIKVASVAGRIIVDLPQPPPAGNTTGYNVAVKARVVGGQICVSDQNAADGVGAQNQQLVRVGRPGPNSPTLRLDVHQIFGQILIDGQGCSRR